MTTFVLKLTLSHSRPSVWRTLSVPGRYRLDHVHRMMQELFGWTDSHLHEFQIGHRRYTDLETVDPHWDEGDDEDEKIRLDKALGRAKSFLYRYDFGDSWEVRCNVLEVLPQDGEAPECLDGAMAGPPDDCGGIPGFQELKAVLANPRHPEHASMKRWAPRGWRADLFPKESINKKLAQKFGRKRSGAKAPSEAVLAGYRLSKLRPGQAAVAALEERAPLSLDEIMERLSQLDYPLPKGRQSLQRAITAVEAIRKRLDGKLELISGPPLERVRRNMKTASGQGLPISPTSTAVELPPAPFGSVTREEMESARPYGLYPPQFSLRRRLILALDAHGGRASLAELQHILQRFEQRIYPFFERDLLVSVKGCRALDLVDEGTVTLDRSHEDTARARARFREWLEPYRKRELEAKHRERLFAGHHERYLDQKLADYRQASGLSRAVFCACQAGEALRLVVLDAGTREAQVFGEAEPARACLEGYDIVAGLDPRGFYEKLGWSYQGRRLLDLTPPFKSQPLGGDRRRSVKLPDAIAMTTGVKPTDPALLARWLASDEENQVVAALRDDALNLLRLWRYGILHGGVRRREHLVGVDWNLGKDFPLGHLLHWSLEDGQPLRLTMRDGTIGFFQPTDLDRRYLYTGERVALGLMGASKRPEPLVLVDVMDAVYPHHISEARIQKITFW